MKVNLGSFEISSVKINFAYEGKNIWINVGNMSDFIAGGNNLGVSGGFMVADAQRRLPSLTEEKVVKLPCITPSGEQTKEYQWHYRIDLDLAIFGLHPDKIAQVETEIHQHLIEGLKDELEE
ncbi:MAG: hypothetical protein ACN4GW_10795 [Desulforhopalus sp.]